MTNSRVHYGYCTCDTCFRERGNQSHISGCACPVCITTEHTTFRDLAVRLANALKLLVDHEIECYDWDDGFTDEEKLAATVFVAHLSADEYRELLQAAGVKP